MRADARSPAFPAVGAAIQFDTRVETNRLDPPYGAPSAFSHPSPGIHLMVSREDIEDFLDRLGADGATHREIEAGLWIVRPGGAIDFDVVVTYNPPVVLMRVKVMPLPADPVELASLSRRLLELNATDLLHGSYGIDREDIVLTAALELAHLDYEEFLASYESMTLSLTSHLREFAAFREVR